MKKVFIVAGDPSGDLIAARLIESMRRMEPSLYVTGLGGAHLQKVSDRFLGNIVEQHALGFWISLKKILFFRNILNNVIIPELKNNPPDAVIPVDFYGFNVCVARAAHRLGRKVFYYVSPQFWASRPRRAEKMREVVDLFLCLFPFEAEFYRQRNLPAKFVGHPILDSLPLRMVSHHQPHVESVIGLLPGSRPEEIGRHLPIMMEACDQINSVFPGTRFLLFKVPHVHSDVYMKIIGLRQKSQCLIEIIQDENFAWRSQLDLAITASGMESLENTLLGIPMVVMYKTNWPTYLVARAMINIKYIAMPNLLSKTQVVPELIQWKATPTAVSTPILDWLKNPEKMKRVREDLLNLRNLFGETGASERAARTILEKVA
jgi:lipid-A-disaccharide synthase